MRLLAVSGSLRGDSHNTRLLRAAAQQLPPGVELELYEGLKQVPPFNEDDEAMPAPEVQAWRAEIEAADAVLFATPEYNSSIPGQLKNAVDWLSRPAGSGALSGKHVAVIGASTGMFGAVWSQAELRKVLGAAGARVVELRNAEKKRKSTVCIASSPRSALERDTADRNSGLGRPSTGPA